MIHTAKSLEIVERISSEIQEQTFHHHYHILYDVPVHRKNPVYVEIGCYAGGSACLMLQRESMNVISIDLGQPIPETTVRKNVSKLNVLNNNFHYLKGNSQTESMVQELKKLTDTIDVLFIDGDHSKEGALKDFSLYNEMVVSGGYIVFDDYNDSVHSPGVKLAVDELVQTLTGYEIIGTLENTFKARPATLKDGNCFVLRKL